MASSSFKWRKEARCKANPNIRTKARPKGREQYEIEVRLVRAIRPDLALAASVYMTSPDTLHQTINEMVAAVRSMIGRYKVIRHRDSLYETTTILLEREADLVMISLLDRALIYRVYRYV